MRYYGFELSANSEEIKENAKIELQTLWIRQCTRIYQLVYVSEYEK